MTIDAPHLQTEQLSALLDQQLPPDEQRQAEQHLAACSRCDEELASLRATVGLLRRLPQVEPPRAFNLPATTIRPLPRPSILLRLVPWTRAAGALAAALFVVLMSADLLAGAGSGQPAPGSASESRPALAPLVESRSPTILPTGAAKAADAARPAAPAPTVVDGAAFQTNPARNQPAADSGASDTTPRPAAAAAPAGGAPAAAAPAQPAPAARAAAPAPAAPLVPAATPGLSAPTAPVSTAPPATATAAPLPTAPVAAPVSSTARPAGPASALRVWQIASGLLAAGLLLAAALLPRLARRAR